MTGFRIAVTGTPGVGKTSFCAQAKWTATCVKILAEKHDCIDPIDEDESMPIDIEQLVEKLNWSGDDILLIDGHLSHLLPVDAIILLRCHPDTLRNRLISREYSVEKINENIECELIGVISAECQELPCLELDSDNGLEAMIADAERWITDGFKPHRPNEPIDWIAQIHGDD
ncbi:MAG: AAA family ATPase [Candidatus Thalassarchaeaceae archaeon]|nr:AAA family ATPase [Candidatus Thalassarchaeaceae archaeon]